VIPEEAALERTVAMLERLAIPYMITGSVASSLHGEPRMTHDADIVVDLDTHSLDRLLEAVSAAGFYVGSDTAHRALQSRRQFNVIEPTSGFKIDLIVLKERSYSRHEFERRRVMRLNSTLTASVASPEDSILSKLEWSRKAGESAVQMSDAAVARVAGAALDVGYIERWAQELGVLELWDRIAVSLR
jgi:hypothetical protein